MIVLTASSVIVFTVVVLVDAGPTSGKYYTTKYDQLDIEAILSNRRMVYYYANCLLGQGPCTPQGLDFKKILPEALETNCLRCTERQKVVTYKTIKRLMKEYPKTWTLLQAQWDPNNIYVKRFEESFRNTPSTAPPENEIIIEDRFGGNEEVTKPSTTTQTKVKKSKPVTSTVAVKTSTLPTIKTSRLPPINSIASASDVKPLRSPQSGVPQNNAGNQVGLPSQEDELGGEKQLSSTTETFTSSTTTAFTSSSSSPVTISTTETPPFDTPVGVTFDIPQSSMSHPQTQELLRNILSSTTKQNTITLPTTTKKTQPSTVQNPISSLVFSFLGPNRPTTIRPTVKTTTTRPPNSQNLNIKSQKISGHIKKLGLRKRTQLAINTTLQVNLRKPLVQVRLPGLAVNGQVDGFNPVGNFVRGLANAGDRLIETGTSIADSVLTSVRGLFDQGTRRSRALRRV